MKYFANLLSIIRMTASIPVFILLYNGMNYYAFYVIILALITDFFDGYFARLYNSISETGKVLDPIADKVLLGSIGLALFVRGSLPLWFISAIIIRDVIILTGGLIAQRKTKYVLPSNYTGKITFAFMSVVIAGIIFDIKYFDTWGIYISTFLIILSLFFYINRYNRFMKSQTTQ
jgi:CDP-diacylglycerol--glycerol-3-phosphate 3-phosphatidyltransferase